MVRVAIHALFDPAAVGGVQANAASMIAAFATRPTPTLETIVLGLPAYLEALRVIAHPQDVAAWPHGQYPIRPPANWELGKPIDTAGGPTTSRWLPWLRVRKPTGDARLRAMGVDCVHFPFQQFFETRLPCLYEPWDLQHRHLPEFFGVQEVAWRDALYNTGCERACIVITATQWTKQDLVAKYRIASEKIAVVQRASKLFEDLYDGRTSDTLPANLPDAFLLFPAFTYGHKNHERLLRALYLLKRDKGLYLPLVCTGRTKGPVWDTIQHTIGELGLNGQVQFLGPVTHNEMIALFRRARCLAFPSLFEGLGLPVLEALAAGLPVAVASSTCLPELVGDDGLLFDARDVAAIATALEMAWASHELLRARAQRARQRLATYRWDFATLRYQVLYRAVARAPLEEAERAELVRLTR